MYRKSQSKSSLSVSLSLSIKFLNSGIYVLLNLTSKSVKYHVTKDPISFLYIFLESESDGQCRNSRLKMKRKAVRNILNEKYSK